MRYQEVVDARWAFGAGAMMRRQGAGRQARPDAVPPDRPTTEAVADANRVILAGLVERMAARDERALADFYDATLGKAYALSMRLLRNAALAEEVVGDAYHQAWREAGRYDRARGGPLTWLLMICRSRALDALRARDPAVAHDAPETLTPEADRLWDEDPLDLLAAVESRGALHDALGSLSPGQRQMIALAFFRGLSHQEIAAHTQLPLGTVKSQIRRALETLRRLLGADQGD